MLWTLTADPGGDKAYFRLFIIPRKCVIKQITEFLNTRTQKHKNIKTYREDIA